MRKLFFGRALAAVLSEELGRGMPDRVHSVLLERFARAVGLDEATLIIPEDHVVPGVRQYVQKLNESFAHSLPRALAAYQFLESSAVLAYGPLYESFLQAGYPDDNLIFFRIHAQVEVEHAETAAKLVERYSLSAEAQALFNQEKSVLEDIWNRFWRDLLESAKTESEG